MFDVSVSLRYRSPQCFQGIMTAWNSPRARLAMSVIIGLIMMVQVLSNPCVLSVLTTLFTSFSNQFWLSAVMPASSSICVLPLSVWFSRLFSFCWSSSSWVYVMSWMLNVFCVCLAMLVASRSPL